MTNTIRSATVLPLAQALQRYFDQTHVSQAAFAAEAGLSTAIISRLASGERTTVRRSTAEKLAKALGVSIDDVLESVRVSQAASMATNSNQTGQRLTPTPEPSNDQQEPLGSQAESLDTLKRVLINLQLEESQVFLNLARDFIVFDEPSLRLHHMTRLKNMGEKRAWIAPLGILLTTFLTLTSATFGDFLSVDASTWKALFMLTAFGSFCWLIVAIVKALKAKSLDDLIEDTKRDTLTSRQKVARNQGGNPLLRVITRIAQIIEAQEATESSPQAGPPKTNTRHRSTPTDQIDRTLFREPAK
jgi:transcriptional regulator with XRE-family HTH domain